MSFDLVYFGLCTAVLRLVPSHKRLLNQAIHSIPIIWPITNYDQEKNRFKISLEVCLEMFFSSDVETYNIVVWIVAGYDGSDTEKIYLL